MTFIARDSTAALLADADAARYCAQQEGLGG